MIAVTFTVAELYALDLILASNAEPWAGCQSKAALARDGLRAARKAAAAQRRAKT